MCQKGCINSMNDITNAKGRLNPAFKRQVVALNSIVNNEFEIQFSMDKLALDEAYRLTVFDALISLDNQKITLLIESLQETPTYINAMEKNAKEQKLRHELSIKSANKVSRLLPITLTLACIIFGFLVLVQTNILQINIVSSSSSSPVDATDILMPVNITGGITMNETPLLFSPIHSIPLIILPVDNPTITMRLHGSNTVGEHLAPALLEAYLRQRGVVEMQWIKGATETERQLQYVDNHLNESFNNNLNESFNNNLNESFNNNLNKSFNNHHQRRVFAIELHAHGSTSAFNDLLTEKADIGMSSRKIKHSEVDMLASQYGHLGLMGSEFIISLDGVAMIVHPHNPLTQLTTLQIAKIFSGDIDNWQQLGGEDRIINVYARDKHSGTWDTFNNSVLKVHHKALSAKVKRHESSSELSALIAGDQAGIGFIGLPYINNNKALSIAATESSNPIYPTHFTISTEDYPLTRRLYMYAPSSSHQMIKDFTQFTIAATGQDIVENMGFISQNIKQEVPYKIKGAPKAYNDYTEIANRLSINFRFKNNSNKLDNKGQKDVLRLVDYMKKNEGRRIVLMGFSDDIEDEKTNKKSSLIHANLLEQVLISYGLSITAVEGFGAQLPIASNNTMTGRSKNRRVEVWVF